LSGFGIDTTDTNSIATLADYSKPLISYIGNLSDGEKSNAVTKTTFIYALFVTTVRASFQVILIGHGCGGASVSYAMEQFPQKIFKAIFVCATIVSSGKKPFDVFSKEEL
ncbi:putative methylesterase 14 chloroplastic, partial [Bienertia sinuspersici]